MKTLLQARALVWILSTAAAAAAQINVGLGGLSSELQCNQTWTNQNVVLRFAPTVPSEDGSGGSCSFGIQPDYIWLYPSRLALDLTRLQQPITRIEADISDYCGPGCTRLFAYANGSQITNVGNPAVHGQTLVLNFDSTHPTDCAVRSFEAIVYGLRIFTQDTPALAIAKSGQDVTVSWPTNANLYVLEKRGDLDGPGGWTSQTNNIQTEATNFVFHIPGAAGTQLFRLRKD